MWNEPSTRGDQTVVAQQGDRLPSEPAIQGFLKIEGLSRSFAQGKPVFADVSFSIDRGEFVAFDTAPAVHSLVSAILYVTMWKHALACNASHNTLNPEVFLRNHVDLLVQAWRQP